MAPPQMIPLAEAALFTIGCAVLNTRRFDPQRVGAALTVLVAALLLALLVTATVTGAVELPMPGPDELPALTE